jgi:hypothetical protein
MARTTLRAKGQPTLPHDARKAAKLEEGDLIEAVVTESGEVNLRPLATIDRSQAWFWTPSGMPKSVRRRHRLGAAHCSGRPVAPLPGGRRWHLGELPGPWGTELRRSRSRSKGGTSSCP